MMNYDHSALKSLTLFVVLAAGLETASAHDLGFSLEPCINGDVSASGLHESQTHEEAVSHYILSHAHEFCANCGTPASDIRVSSPLKSAAATRSSDFTSRGSNPRNKNGKFAATSR